MLSAVYELDASKLAVAIEMILDHRQLSVQEPDLVAKALEHYRRKPSLGFSDCMILEVARRAGHKPLGTFDRTLAKLDGVKRL